MAPEQPGRIARIGALFVAPRRLARRDLDAADGKAGDDLILLSMVALVVQGAPSLVRAAGALSAGRTNTALRLVVSVLQPALPLFGAWALASLALMLFTLGQPRRAAGELGARVTSALVLASLFVAPLVGLLSVGPLRFTLQSLPWAIAAVVFGLVLREAVGPSGEERPWPRTFGAGAVATLLVVASGLFLADRALVTTAQDRPPEGIGAVAPGLDLPLLGAGRLQLAMLHGRPVVLSFWATWCGPCLEELPVLERLQRARPAGATPVYAVNVDEPGPSREAAVRAVVARLGLSMPIALDDGAAGQAYSVSTIPTLVRVGADGRIEQLWDRPLDEAGLRDAMK